MVWVVVRAGDECNKSGVGRLIGLDRLDMRDGEQGDIQGCT